MSIPTSILTAAAGGLALIAAGTGLAAADGGAPAARLDQLCVERGGTPVASPYSIARCQGARANKGFEAERLTCEDLADGMFSATRSTTRMNRASWGCFPTSPPA